MVKDSWWGAFGMFWILFIIGGIIGWINHLIVCFTDDRWGFLIAGAIMFPIAVIHGLGALFGAW